MQPMTWASPDDTNFSSDYGFYEIKRESKLFYLSAMPYGPLGQFLTLDAAKKAAEIHAIVYAGADDTFARLLKHLNGEAPV